MKKKTTQNFVAQICVLSDAWYIWVRNYLFLKNYVTSEGVFPHNLVYFQQLSIAQYQVNLYANINFE